MAQLVKCLTLDFCSGLDLAVCGFKPCVGLSALTGEPASDSSSLSAPLLLTLSLFLKQTNIHTYIDIVMHIQIDVHTEFF